MQLGWIDFSKTERDKVVSVLDLLSEQGVLDELGIAQIRDGFANLFFPGTTTIQTRAKYFLIIPYIFKSLESNPTKDYSRLKKELNDLERNCAVTLLEKNPEESGVIGKRSISQNKWVQRPPSNIYWAGLKTYRIFHSDVSIDQYLNTICFRKSLKSNISRSGNSNDNPDEGHDDKGAGDIQSFNFWKIPKYEEDWFNKLEMDLTKEEGEFLKEQIISSCPDSMFAFILKNNRKDILEFQSFSDLEQIENILPEDMKKSFHLAKDFSDFNLVLRILFNVIASDGENDEANKLLDVLKPDLTKIADFDLKEIFSLLRIRDMPLKSFLLNAQELMKEEKIWELKDLIKNREIFLKGENRSKTCHPGEFGDKWLAGFDLDYRFFIAKIIAEDIFKSEEYVDDKNFDSREEL